MMTNPLISIIIPMYNAQDYILKALESVKNQSYDNFEVIIVNDGSSDECARICSEYIKREKVNNFYLINKENGGVSSARNVGLDCAKGKWIAFLDSDDWLETDMLSNMIDCDCKYHADYYVSGCRAYEAAYDEYDIWSNYSVMFGTMPDGLKNLALCDYVWGRFYKKSIIDEYTIRFDERIKFCEDNAFNFDYIGSIQTYACIQQIGYNYRRGHVTAMSQGMVSPFMRKYIAEHMYAFCDKIPMESICEALKENVSILRMMWNAILTDVVVNILENNTAQAKEIMNKELTSVIINSYEAKNKKDKVLLFLWNKPFCVFQIFILLFYKNINYIKRIKKLSYFLTH